ncbi:MAG: c-type cytochrome [Pontibacterium sp.]
MKRLVILCAISAFVLAGWFSLPLLVNPQPEVLSVSAGEGNVSRGAYLARASGCIACHTDVAANGKPLAGGAALKTPFGDFYAPNLTTDAEHGMGSWTLAQFSTAVRQGISPEGRPYYPAFPYSFYTKLSDQDIADLWAAFQTVPAVNEPSTEHKLSFPFNLREGLALWQRLFFKEGRFVAPVSDDERYARGAYWVESASHCAACHTPRNFLGALDNSRALAGSEALLEGEGSVPAINAEALKAAGWTLSDLSYALQSGLKPDGDVFGGSMGEVVREGTSFMQKADLDAIAFYLLNRR